MMVNIVTSICVDIDESGKDINYPMLGKDSNRREIYWRCVTTFCLTSLRFNYDQKHIVFTNDSDRILIENFDVKKRLCELGVEIIEHQFDRFDPQNHSHSFRNAFYKFEVVNLLSNFDSPSILLDSDCIWTKRDDELFNVLNSGQYLLLQDTYQRSSFPLKKKPHNLSMEDMANLYKTIPVNQYNRDYAVWYGGELIGGTPEHFKLVGENLSRTLDYCKKQENSGNKLLFSNGNSIFDNDEFIGSYVYNSLTDIEIYDTFGKFSKRMWTLNALNNVCKKDVDLAIWHLTAEKKKGLKALFYEITNENSLFWSSNENLAFFLGSFVGIPKRKLSTFEKFVIILNKSRLLTITKSLKRVLKFAGERLM
jgi:hypothetical protein